MPLVSHLTRRALRHTVIASACVAALATTVPAAADVTVGVNLWLGASAERSGSNTDWFNAANWFAGPLFGLPDEIFPVDISPSQIIVNGFPTDSFILPSSEAVLGGSFSMSSMYMRAWDGISQLRLTHGGLLTTSATIGALNNDYQPTGAIRPATLVLDGGNTAGSWSFLAHSRVVVNGNYGLPGGSWSGNLGQLQINSGSALTLPAGNSLTIDQVSNAGGLTVAGGNSITVAGSFQNAGSFTLGGDSTNGTAALYLSGNTTLTGTGTTVLTDANYSYIGGSAVLTVDTGHTLRGAGYVATSVVNRGTVIADGVLTVGASGNFDNAGGTVQVADGAMLSLGNYSFSGGVLQGLGAGSRFSGSGTFQNLALSGQFIVTPGSPVNVAGTLTNTGTLTLGGNGTQGTAAMYLAADTTLAGTGTTVLTDANYSYIGGGSVLTIGSGHTLRGAGYVAASIVNQGKVIADGVLTVNAGGNFDNGSGVVQVADGATLALSGGTFSGGTVQGLGAGSMLSGNGTFQATAMSGRLTLRGGTTLDGVSSSGVLTVEAGASTSTRGTLTNTGTLTLGGNGTQGTAAMYLAADTTLAGTGATVLTDANYSYIGGGSVLTIGSGHTLRGAGYVAASIANQGKVIADGVLTVNAGGNFDNGSGVVQVADGGMLALSGGTFTGGSLQGLGAGSMLSGNGTFQGTAMSGRLTLQGGTTLDGVSNSGLLTVDAGASASTRGTLTNNGTLTIGGNGNRGTAALYLVADTTLAGTGTTMLTDANYSYIGSNGVLTIASGHTLRGTGYIATGMANRGTVIADGLLNVNASGNFDNSNGLVQVADGATLSLSGGSFSGGTLQGLGAGSRLAGNGTYQNTMLRGQLLVAAGSAVYAAGTLANTGTLTIRGNGSQGTAAIYLAADTTLSGGGSTVLTDANYSTIGGSSVLTVGSGQTLRGAGYVTTSVVNQGTVVATGVLTVNAGTGSQFTNSGRLQVDAGAQVDAQSGTAGIVQTGAGATTVVNGLLKAPTLTLNAGTLQGSGTVQADVLNLGGTINAGNSPGKLSITGNLTLGDGSLLLVEVAGPARGTQFDWLDVTGNVVLDGDLRLDFNGYTPQVGQQFSFLTTSSGSISGRFDHAWANGWTLALQYDTQGVTATVTAVPEPGSWALLLLGAAGLGAWLRRRQANGA